MGGRRLGGKGTDGMVMKGREKGWFGGVGKKYSDMVGGLRWFGAGGSRCSLRCETRS